MRKPAIASMAVVVMFLFTIPGICSDIDGQWIGVKDGPDGKKMELRYRFRAKGNELIGLIETRLGGGPISEGKIDGNIIEFKLITSGFTVINTGKLSGDEIHLTETSGAAKNNIILRRIRHNR